MGQDHVVSLTLAGSTKLTLKPDTLPGTAAGMA